MGTSRRCLLAMLLLCLLALASSVGAAPSSTSAFLPLVRQSPGAVELVYAAGYPGTSPFDIMGLTTANLVVNVTNTPDESEYEAAWSPDGAYLGYISGRDGLSDVYVMRADGGEGTRLAASEAPESSLAWSPDSQHIAFISERDGNAEIYVQSLDGTPAQRLTTTSAPESEPQWSPDGERIAFVSERDGNMELYVMHANGGGVQRLTRTPTVREARPRWSPDGSELAFGSENDEGYALEVVRLADQQRTRMVSESFALQNVPEASWSPDGQTLAFSWSRRIELIQRDGTRRRELTFDINAWRLSDPAWSPDGQRIAYTATYFRSSQVRMVAADGSPVTLPPLGGLSTISPVWAP